MARDIEEFLRKAAERRKQQGAGAKTPKPQQPKPRQPLARQPPQVPKPPQRSRQRPPAAPVEPVIVLDQTDIVEKSRLASNFKSSIDTSSISKHADGLGKGVRSAVKRLDRGVDQYLDHDIGKLGNTPTVTNDPEPKIAGAKDMTMVAELRKLLANKKTVGQAIILSEILKRPDFD